MKLTDLEPRWLTQDVFIFRNPTGGNDWLTCKRVPMSMKDQYQMVYGDVIDWPGRKTEWVGKTVVFTQPEYAWSFDGNDFESMTVTPSIDASASGNWHGFITNGEIK